MNREQTAPARTGRRAGAGAVRLTGRDVTGLILCAEQYGAPYDLLATALDARPDRLRAIVARWRHAGYAATGTLTAGPAWCWLTPAGMTVTGLPYPASRPALSRLAHIRAVLAVRLWLQAGQVYRDGRAWWRSERRIRAAIGGRVGTAHIPDAELYAAFGIQIIWNAPMRQATFHATITDTTPAIVTALLARANDPATGQPAATASDPTRANTSTPPLQGLFHTPIEPKRCPNPPVCTGAGAGVVAGRPEDGVCPRHHGCRGQIEEASGA
jgi:hypothetical protein